MLFVQLSKMEDPLKQLCEGAFVFGFPIEVEEPSTLFAGAPPSYDGVCERALLHQLCRMI